MIRLRYRIDGALHDMLRLPHSMANPIVSRVKIMAGLNIVERRRPQDGQISIDVDGAELDIRVAVAPTLFGEKVVMRLLDKSSPLYHHHELGMYPDTGLRSMLRQDPDVILVGEIRDTETARIAVRSALTGHLVLSSIHATDAASAIQRFIDMGIEPFLLTSSLIGVVAQCLVRRVCGSCRVKYKPAPDELAFFKEAGGSTKATFVRGEGCSFCANSGYLGRIGVFELMTLDDDIRELITKGASRDQLRDTAVANGMSTLRDQGIRLVEEDVTTISEVVRHMWTI